MKIYIDDIRDPPDKSWTVIRELNVALDLIKVLEFYESKIEAISFDHDLGGDDTTRPVMMFLCEKNYWPKNIIIHTANPVGREYLEQLTIRYAPAGILKRNY